ncbi:MAG TPA: DUF1801 domain-containing protein, partial [Polyangiaceae bacterium]|nr:DUF1801 domain-containing protein [Polyangiaceae bacterium]
DGAPTACVQDAAFGYVNVYRAHMNVGLFNGAVLPDPAGLLEGSGKFMRHVKVRPGAEPDSAALSALIAAAYRDMKGRLKQKHRAMSTMRVDRDALPATSPRRWLV